MQNMFIQNIEILKGKENAKFSTQTKNKALLKLAIYPIYTP